MAEEHTRATRRSTPLLLIRRALGRPYLFMAAVLLIIGALWFIRLALEEFLLLDRLVNVYTDEAQIKMDTFAIKPGVTPQYWRCWCRKATRCRRGRCWCGSHQMTYSPSCAKHKRLPKASPNSSKRCVSKSPLAIERARGEVTRARALLETKEQAYQRAQALLLVERDRLDKMLREQEASLEAARARLREQDTSFREADMTPQRTRTLFADGIVPQDRLDAAQLALERARARLQAAQEQVYQIQEQYPARDSPHMTRVHEKDLQRHGAEIKEQRVALELASTNLRLVETGEQRRKVVEAKYKEALAQVETAQLHLAKTTMLSPVDGIVGYRKVEPGETVKGDAGHPPHHAHP